MTTKTDLQAELARIWALPCASGGNPAQTWHHRKAERVKYLDHCPVHAKDQNLEVPTLRVILRSHVLGIGATAWSFEHRISINIPPVAIWSNLCQTLAHEVSHLLVPYRVHHGREWQNMFAQVLWEGYGIVVDPRTLHRVSNADVTDAIARSQDRVNLLSLAAE